jgi:hypothetical protein
MSSLGHVRLLEIDVMLLEKKDRLLRSSRDKRKDFFKRI